MQKYKKTEDCITEDLNDEHNFSFAILYPFKDKDQEIGNARL